MNEVARLRRERDAFALQAQFFARKFQQEQEAHDETLRELSRIVALGAAMASHARVVVDEIEALKEVLA